MIFTSGGSEANCLALKGAIAGALAAEDRITRLFVSAIEHESVRAAAAALAESVPGLKVSTIPATSDGMLDLNAFRLQLMQGKGRTLVSVMAANNETGVIQDLAGISRVLGSDGGEDVLLHVDAVQAAGRIPMSFAAFDADYVTLSAHKLGGPQGAGALIAKDEAPARTVDPRRRTGIGTPRGNGERRRDRRIWRGRRRRRRLDRCHALDGPSRSLRSRASARRARRGDFRQARARGFPTHRISRFPVFRPKRR